MSRILISIFKLTLNIILVLSFFFGYFMNPLFTIDEKGHFQVFGGFQETDFTTIIDHINFTKVVEHIKFFESLGSRVTGYIGNIMASKYIYDVFKSYGLSVHYQNFTVTVPIESEESIISIIHPMKLSLKAYALMPNLAAPVITPEEGIIGPLIYVKDGSYGYFDGLNVNGSIVLMDFNSGMRWLTAANLGAKAVVFIEPEDTLWQEAYEKSIDIPYKFPRLYIRRNESQILLNLLSEGEVIVNIRASQKWVNVEGRNVIGIIPGYKYPERIVILSAYYDSYSVVPGVAPGAEEAVSVSFLLEFAKYFSINRPKHTIWFVAFGAHNQGLIGSINFVQKYVIEDWDQIGKNFTLQINLSLNSATSILGPCFTGGYYGILQASGTTNVPVLPFVSRLYDIFVAINKVLQEKYEICREGILSSNEEWLKLEPEVPLYSDHEPMLATGGPAINILTAYKLRLRLQTPKDTFDRLKLHNLKKQIEIISAVLHYLVNFDDLREVVGVYNQWNPQRGWNAASHWTVLKGIVVEYSETIGWYSPLPNALFFYKLAAGWLDDQIDTSRPWIAYMTNEKGEFLIPGVLYSAIYRYYYWRAYVIDEKTGDIIYAPDHGHRMFARPRFQATMQPIADIGYVVLHKCGSLVLFNVLDPNTLEIPRGGAFIISILDARTDSLLERYGFELTQPCVPRNGFSVAVAYIPPEIPIKILIQAPYAIKFPLLILTNATQECLEGCGFSVSAGEQIPLILSELHYLRDLIFLDESRLAKLAQSVSPHLLLSHQEHKESFLKIYDLLQKRYYSMAFGKIIELLVEERSLYINVRSIFEDTIFTVPYISLFLLPFAFLFERLIFHRTGGQRIFLIIIIIIMVILTLRCFHPGFLLATDPIMILIGFTIIILIAPVYWVVIGHIKRIIRVLRHAKIGVHSLEKASLEDVLIESFSVSVENMRKRPFRTVLSFISIVLIALSLVMFTSLQSFSIIKPGPFTGSARYDGIMIKHQDWATLSIPLGETFCNSLLVFKDNVTIAPRVWAFARYRGIVPLWGILNGSFYPFMGVLGLSPYDPLGIKEIVTEGRFFLPEDKYVCIISEEIAKKFGIKIGEKISLSGLELTVVGLIDQYAFDSLVDLDQEAIGPLDPTIPSTWNVHFPAERIIILPYETALKIGGWIVSVSLVVHRTDLTHQIAENIFRRTGLPVIYSVNGQLHSVTSRNLYTVFGLEFQMVPLALATLVVLNIMLGAVYERNREIRIYSLVGLSPLQVSLIFVSESLIYAIVGGICGYIIAMTTLSLAVSHGLIPLLFSLNYSSSRSVFSLSLIFAATIISSLYPAYKSSRVVTPSLERVWKIPTKPSGDKWNIPMPFSTIDLNEVKGFFNFLEEFLRAHKGERAPVFTIQDMKYYSMSIEPSETRHVISIDMRVEPYELGITQLFEIVAVNRKPDPKYYFMIEITRKSGHVNSWCIMNRNVLELFRSQFLVWRSLSVQQREKYISNLTES